MAHSAFFRMLMLLIVAIAVSTLSACAGDPTPPASALHQSDPSIGVSATDSA